MQLSKPLSRRADQELRVDPTGTLPRRPPSSCVAGGSRALCSCCQLITSSCPPLLYWSCTHAGEGEHTRYANLLARQQPPLAFQAFPFETIGGLHPDALP